MKRLYALLLTLLGWIFLLITPSVSYAACPGDPGCADFVGPPAPTDNITNTDFTLNVSSLSPRDASSATEYNQWPKKNLQTFLVKVARMMLIIIPVVAVILLIVAGIMMATAMGNTEQIGKAKTIIQLNIAAVIVALLSAAIIRFVAYVLWQ